MAKEFSKAVEFGLKLSKRIYYGKDTSSMSAPRPPAMKVEADNYLPTAVMVYAEINEPAVVDNPDVPSYQPYVYGRCEPPALIPLHMHGISMAADCYLDTAFITVGGAWRVHCVSASGSCDCRIAVPISEEGSVQGIEVHSSSKSYHSKLITLEAPTDADKVAKSKEGFLIKGQIYTLKIPKVDGGTVLSIKFSWSQKLVYKDGQFRLHIPFTFPSYVHPLVKTLMKREKISVNVSSGTDTEFLYQSVNHPLKRIREEAGKVGFAYEAEVSTWSTNDFSFSYNVVSSDSVCGLLLQPPSLDDCDRREMFCFYLYPGKEIHKKFSRRQVIFVVDTSASMRGSPLEYVKTALSASLSNLNPTDTFNIIAFNESSSVFSPSLEPATDKVIQKASKWIEMNFRAEGGTNISSPLNQAIDMVSRTGDSLPIIFLITDGAVEDEKEICAAVKVRLTDGGLISPRICTFGIGSYCNHYFLQMLAQAGRGHYDASFDVDSVNLRLERLINCASSVILADITIDALKHLDSLEIYPAHIPDLLSGHPLLISGRYCGNLPGSVKISGILSDFSNFVINARVKKAKDIPFLRVFARRQINALTAHAWYTGSKQDEEKVRKLSLHTGMPSEYSPMILIETVKRKLPSMLKAMEEETAEFKEERIIFLRSLRISFGNVKATVENRAPEHAEPKLYETSDMIFKAAANWCSGMVDCCCCMCCIQFCNRLNGQCAIVLAQLCTILACFGCIEGCFDICGG